MPRQLFRKGEPRPANAGRRKGTPNKATVRKREMRAAIQASGKDPMTFFAEVLSNPDNPFDARFDAAKELLPFMHPRLASIESRRGGKTHEERLEQARQMLQRRNIIDITRSTATDLEPINGSHEATPRGRVKDAAGGGG